MSFNLSKTWQAIDDILSFLSATMLGRDKGLRIIGGQLSVGSVNDPRETVLGHGDSFPVETVYHADIVNTTGLVITGAIDIQADISSDLVGSASLFGGTQIGKYILFGIDHPTHSLKVLTNTAGIMGSDNITAEYLVDSGGIWEKVSFMSVESELINDQLAEVLTTRSSEQWRIGFNPLIQPTIWEKAIININGANIEKYWLRFRISNTISLDAIINQIKIGTSRLQVKGNGRTEYFDDARYTQTILASWANVYPNKLKNPKDLIVDYGVGMGAEKKKNKWEDNTEDGVLLPITITRGIDTSIPIVVTLKVYPATESGAAAVKFGIEALNVKEGHIFDGLATPELQTTAIDNYPANSDLVGREVKFLIPINKLVPGDEVVISIYRMGNDAQDTTTGAIIIEELFAEATKWAP